ncbi:NUDIX domain-containing protein [Micromonospora sp. NBC_01699]|uniref:NUDIX hydrolase n=1 Tax=Micromonospora sp. NBC_01699 TaxID=2975984 RepID=UPI002E2F294D|nr:NUDIX domain-containing protein [Micromonospora sp. NBC_01699]
MTDEATYRRRAARVLLLDGADRVLLLQYLSDPDNPGLGYSWSVPGGGVDEGESLAQAAARELREEVGLAVHPDQLGDPVAYTSGYADLGWAAGNFRDDFFRLRVDSHEVDVSGMAGYELTVHVGHRWWPVPELASTRDTVHPTGLAALLTNLLTEPRPPHPHQLPWHH